MIIKRAYFNSIKYFLLSLLFLSLHGCNQENLTFRKLIATDNAVQMEENYNEIASLLIKYKNKLDKRNPKSFNKTWQKSLITNIKNQQNVSLYDFKDNYNKYLKHAFNTEVNIKNRNDALIIGLYKLLYFSYGISNKKYTALSYKMKNLKDFSDVLQIIRWQIKYKKNEDKDYLFLTWQKNWQVELLKKINLKKPNYNLIKNLTYINNKKESIFDSSNMSFETIISKILYINNDSIKRLGGEPNELTIDVLKFFVFL